MRFKRIGTTYQLRLETGEDLADILELDESLWVATSAPVSAFRCDGQFLSMVDADGNGRINSDELKEAARWLLERLADTGGVADGSDTLPLSAIETETDEGRGMVETARYILEQEGEGGADVVSVPLVREFIEQVSGRPLNGDGVIVPDAADEPEVAGLIRDIISCVGGTPDTRGEQGVSGADLEAFMSAARDFLDWKATLDEFDEGSMSDLLPLGTDTPDAWHLLQEHAGKVDAFFDRVRFLDFRSPGGADEMGWPTPELEGTDLADRDAMGEALRGAPVARPTPDGALPLAAEQINPFYREWMDRVKERVIGPLLGEVPDRLGEDDWRRVRSAFDTYAAYVRDRRGAEVESLPPEKLERYLEGDLRQRVEDLLERDCEVADIVEGARRLLRLLLYHQHLLRLARNFVSFPELFSTEQTALFEQGRTVMDGRWFNCAFPVEDPAKHAAQAASSDIFVLYLEITGTPDQPKRYVAVPVTAGAKGNLRPEKRGVFFDTDGHELDARVVNIVENPISLRQALTAPFVSFWQFVGGRVQGFVTSARQKLGAGVEQTAAAAASGQSQGQQQQPAAGGGGTSPVTLLAGVSVSIAALGSAFAFTVSSLSRAGPRPIAYALLAVLAIIFLPLLVRTLWRLRRQDLSALLEASGWAINHRMRLNRRLRHYFTARKQYPRHAEGGPARRWLRIALIALALCALAVGSYLAVSSLHSPGQAPGPDSSTPGQQPDGDAAGPQDIGAQEQKEPQTP